ncbi:MAG: type VI secretion system contractile sheath small subunit, partial [Candidatus Eisenbacteria bacterium]|nr:type VI secretion system contractile sheath small subunit [Candidatus Eisenbacteria bacterium]
MDKSEAALDLVVVSDLWPEGGDDPPLEGFLRVDPSELDALLARSGPMVRLPGAGADADLLVRLQSFRDFRPEGLAERAPALRELLGLRRTLEEARRGRAQEPALMQALAACRALLRDEPEEPAGRA